MVVQMKRRPARRSSSATPLPLSEVREQLSPLVTELAESEGQIAISVRGHVRAYVVSARRMEKLELLERTQGVVAPIGAHGIEDALQRRGPSRRVCASGFCTNGLHERRD